MGIQRLRLRTGKFFASIALVIAWTGSLMAQAGAGTTNAPVGIPRELARERAQRVSDVRYQLRYALFRRRRKCRGMKRSAFC